MRKRVGTFPENAFQYRFFHFVLLVITGSITSFFYWLRNPDVAAGGEAYALALSLARHGTFANPFFHAGDTGASAHMTPLWPLTMALLMRGLGAWFRPGLFILALLANGLNAALLPLISRRLLGDALPGLIAGIAVAVLPVYQLCPAWDAMFAADLLMICVLVARPRSRSGWLQGALAGILFLLNPVAGVVFVVLAAWNAPRRLRFALTAACVLVAILTPWTIRNYRHFGRFVPLRDDLGIALYSSNNDCAMPTLEQNIVSGCHDATHPVNNFAENRMVLRLGEVEYNKVRMRSALGWIGANPAPFFSLSLQRFFYFWFPWQRPAVCIVSVFGFVGLGLMLRQRRCLGMMFLCALAAGSGLYYFVEAQDRYRFPVYWCLCLCAGYLVTRFARPKRELLKNANQPLINLSWPDGHSGE